MPASGTFSVAIPDLLNRTPWGGPSTLGTPGHTRVWEAWLWHKSGWPRPRQSARWLQAQREHSWWVGTRFSVRVSQTVTVCNIDIIHVPVSPGVGTEGDVAAAPS